MKLDPIRPDPDRPGSWEVLPRRIGYRWRVSVKGQVWGPWTFAWTRPRAERAVRRMVGAAKSANS